MKEPELETEDVNWKHIAHGLYRILDDISTASDHYKPENTKYTNYIYKKLEKVNNYMWSDGYSVYGKTKLPVEEYTNNPMEDYFLETYEVDQEFKILFEEEKRFSINDLKEMQKNFLDTIKKSPIFLLRSWGNPFASFDHEPSVEEMDIAYAKYLGKDYLPLGTSEQNCVLLRFVIGGSIESWAGSYSGSRYNWAKANN